MSQANTTRQKVVTILVMKKYLYESHKIIYRLIKLTLINALANKDPHTTDINASMWWRSRRNISVNTQKHLQDIQEWSNNNNGDWNAKISKTQTQGTIIKYGTGELNARGEKLLQFVK